MRNQRLWVVVLALALGIPCLAPALAGDARAPVALAVDGDGDAEVMVWASGSDSDDEEGAKALKRIMINAGGGGSFLGIGVADVDAERAKALSLREEQGVEVTNVVDGSAADKAGIQKSDVILEYNGQRIEGTAQFMRMVRETPVGRTVKLLASRGGKTQTFTATLGQRTAKVYGLFGKDDFDVDDLEDLHIEIPEPPEPPEAPEAPDAYFHSWTMPDIPSPMISWRTLRLGVETEGLGTQLAEFFGVKEGILVRAVVKGSPAEKAGIKAGDVITKIGGESVSRPGEISSILRSRKAGDEIQVTLVRGGRDKVVPVKLEESSTTLYRKAPVAPKIQRNVIKVPSGGDEL